MKALAKLSLSFVNSHKENLKHLVALKLFFNHWNDLFTVLLASKLSIMPLILTTGIRDLHTDNIRQHKWYTLNWNIKTLQWNMHEIIHLLIYKMFVFNLEIKFKIFKYSGWSIFKPPWVMTLSHNSIWLTFFMSLYFIFISTQIKNAWHKIWYMSYYIL